MKKISFAAIANGLVVFSLLTISLRNALPAGDARVLIMASAVLAMLISSYEAYLNLHSWLTVSFRMVILFLALMMMFDAMNLMTMSLMMWFVVVGCVFWWLWNAAYWLDHQKDEID